MKNISNYLKENQQLHITEQDEIVDEGLKDLWNAVKSKFAKVVEWLGGLAARISSRFPVWLALDSEGNSMPASTPATASQAYKDGFIDKKTTVVVPSSIVKKMTGNNAKPSDCYKLYGSGNSLQYYTRLLKESKEPNHKKFSEILKEEFGIINEIKITADGAGKRNVVDNQGLMREISYQIAHPTRPALLIWGAPGIGKTAILQSVIDSLPDSDEWSLITKTLQTATPDSFSLPAYNESDRGEKMATDIPKDWLPVYKPSKDKAVNDARDKACGKGILFLDELSRVKPDVINACFGLLNEREIDGWKVGSGWVVIGASNRFEDDPENQIEISKILGNRLKQKYYQPMVNDWKVWAEKQNFISPLLLSWLEMADSEIGGQKYFYFDPEEYSSDNNGVSDPQRLMATPRSWTNAMVELADWSNTGSLEGWTIFDIPEDVIESTLGSYIPDEAIDGFMAFLHTVSKIGDFDNAVKEVWTNNGSNLKISQKDLAKIAVPVTQLLIASHSSTLPTAEEFLSMCTWLNSQDSDQLASMMVDMVKNIYFDALAQGREKTEKDPRNIGFSLGATIKKYQDLIKNPPADMPKDVDKREEWFNEKTAGLDSKSPEYKEIDAAANAESRLSYFLAEADKICKKGLWKDPATFPDYKEGIKSLQKRFKGAVMIETPNGTESLF